MLNKEIRFRQTSFGRIAYREAGDPDLPPVLLVHGIPTSGYLWREVMGFLCSDFYCLAPDLMGLGHSQVDPQTPMDMESQAEMLLEFMTGLGHEQFSAVCHDQGGAATQIMAARCPKRVTCLVLSDCVCYDNWPVPVIARYQKLARLPVLIDLAGRFRLFSFLETCTPLSAFRRGVYDSAKMTADAIREYLGPLQRDAQGRARFKAFLLAGHPRYNLQAVPGLKRFERPTLVVWAADDHYISPSWGKRLSEDIPGVERFVLVPFCGHFWQEERPAEFSSHILEFLKKHT